MQRKNSIETDRLTEHVFLLMQDREIGSVGVRSTEKFGLDQVFSSIGVIVNSEACKCECGYM